MAPDSRIRDAAFSVSSADVGSIAAGGWSAEEIDPCFEKRRLRLLSWPQSSRELSRRPSRPRAVDMLADMAAVTAVDTRHGGVHSVGHVHGGFHSVSHVGGAFRTVGHLCGFHHIAHFRRGFRGFGAYAYYDDYGC